MRNKAPYRPANSPFYQLIAEFDAILTRARMAVSATFAMVGGGGGQNDPPPPL